MPVTYEVKQGDTLTLIARRYSLSSWREIYDLPENAPFRLKRPDPNRIYPGDELILPIDSPPRPPPAPPVPTVARPAPRTLAEVLAGVTAYLSENLRRDVVKVMFGRPENLLVLAEIHYTKDDLKASLLTDYLFALLRFRSHSMNFHASERYLDDPPTHERVRNYMKEPARTRFKFRAELPSPRLLRLAPVLSSIADFPNRCCAFLAADRDVRGKDMRHKVIFDTFQESVVRYNQATGGGPQINSTSARGTFLLGSFHASRLHDQGHAVPTTCQRLLTAGWSVHVIRLTVDESFNVPREDMNVQAIGSPGLGDIDLLPVLNSVAGDKPFYASLTERDSPFSQLTLPPPSAPIPYNILYDAIVHLP